MTRVYFRSAAEFRQWLRQHGASAQELWLGYYKRATGEPSLTWSESVDQALCFGWIDGIRKRVDEERYTIRFTPRKAGSTWSSVNLRRIEALHKQGLMRPAGLAAFEARRENRSGVYSYEQRPMELPPPYAAPLKKNRRAQTFFDAQPASYRRAAIWWVVSAKQEATRSRRIEQLIEDSQSERRIKQFVASKPPPVRRAAKTGNGAVRKKR
jgi:uncharacterized protein YdeI (YjbR/CyaY-like superfamily)